MSEHRFSFEQHVSVGYGNKIYGRDALATAYVNVGPFRLHVYLMDDGTCHLSESLRDDDIRDAIAADFRTRVLAELTKRWANQTGLDAKRTEERKQPAKVAPPVRSISR